MAPRRPSSRLMVALDSTRVFHVSGSCGRPWRFRKMAAANCDETQASAVSTAVP